MKKSIYLSVFILLTLFSFLSCIPEEKEKDPSEAVIEDRVFAEKIEALSSNAIVDYVYIDSLDGMISETKPNLIVWGKLLSRGECARNGMFGSIYTPYELEIYEVYHGNINKSGDKININAPYGIVNGVEYKGSDKYPIFYIEEEYILFLRVEEIYGELIYDLCFDPACSLILNPDGAFKDHGVYSDSIFSKYGHDTEKLLTELKELIENNNYGTEIEKYPKEES